MLGIDLKPTAYRVESAEPPAANYVFGTVKARSGAAIGVELPNRVRVDRYPVDNPQSWLSSLLNLSAAQPETARQFVLDNGVIDLNAVMCRPKELPPLVRKFWKEAEQKGRVPFALPLRSLWNARRLAEERRELAEQAQQSNTTGMMARIQLVGALINGPLRSTGIGVGEGPAASLVAYVDPKTLEEAIDLCILDYYANPEIANCITCGRFFRKSKPGRLFCDPKCKNLYHVRKYREGKDKDAKRHGSQN